MSRRLLFIGMTLACGLVGCASQSNRPDDTLPSLSVNPLPAAKTADGQPVSPLDAPQGTRATVLLFIATECPIANGYAPEMNRIIEAYRPRDVRFYFVQSDPDVSPDAARKHASEFGLKAPVVMDETGALARHVGATVTPEAAVLLPDGSSRAYLGRIDDLYVAFGKRRHEPTVRELRNALDAVLAGTPAVPPGGRAVGCSIPDAKPRTSAD